MSSTSYFSIRYYKYEEKTKDEFKMNIYYQFSWNHYTHKNILVIHLGGVCDKEANINDLKRSFDN